MKLLDALILIIILSFVSVLLIGSLNRKDPCIANLSAAVMELKTRTDLLKKLAETQAYQIDILTEQVVKSE